MFLHQYTDCALPRSCFDERNLAECLNVVAVEADHPLFQSIHGASDDKNVSKNEGVTINKAYLLMTPDIVQDNEFRVFIPLQSVRRMKAVQASG